MINNIKYKDYCNKFKGYRTFLDSMINKYVSIPGVGNNYVPQGICKVKEYFLITFYDYTKIANSIICVIDDSSKKFRIVYLDGKYHCGGIGYHEKSNSIYITGSSMGNSSYINKYDCNDILSKDKVYAKVKFRVDDNNTLKSSISGKSSVAYLFVLDNQIYLGNFSFKGDGRLKWYYLDDKGNLLIDSCFILDNPYINTQGMCKYKYMGNDYYLFSTSFGRKNDSIIYIAILNNNKFKTIKKIRFPAMSEQINVDKNGIVYIIFESGAYKYRGAKNRICDVCFFEFKKLLKDKKFKFFDR